MSTLIQWRVDLPSVIVVAVGALLLSWSVTLGADSLWLVALGQGIAQRGFVPAGVPFTDGNTAAWVNVPVLGELVFAGAHALGSWGLLALQVMAALSTLTLTAIGAKRLGGASSTRAVAIALVALGALPTLGVVRAQAMSLVPFVGLILLLRSQHRGPDKRIWFAVPVLVVWGNLHGAVLVGIAVTGAYLLGSRLRKEPVTAIAVGIASVAAVWATPAGLRSHEYYLAVLGSAAADRGQGLWGRISFSSPFDNLLVVTGLVLLLMAWRSRPPLWEWVAIVGLVAMTIQTSRHGVWLLLFLAPRAAVARCTRSSSRVYASRRRLAIASAVVLLASAFTIKGVSLRAESVDAVLSLAKRISASLPEGGAVLAPPVLAEALAGDGATIWAGNPLDAFPRDRQEVYLDFIKDPATVEPQGSRGPEYVVLQQGESCPIALCPLGDVVTVVPGFVVYQGRTR